MILTHLSPLTVSPFFLATIIIAVAAIVVYEMLRWIVGRIALPRELKLRPPSDAELQKLDDAFKPKHLSTCICSVCREERKPVDATRDTRFQSAVSDISPGDVVVISEPKSPSPFIRRAQEQFPEAGIEDNDDALMVSLRIMAWRFDRIEDRLENLEAVIENHKSVIDISRCRLDQLEAARKPIKKRREKKGGKR